MDKKIRIAQRQGDGTIFSWTPLLNKNPKFRSGWKTIKENGEVSIILDTSEPMVMDNKSQSEIERVLMEENATLKKMLSEMGWDGKIPPPKPEVEASLEPGETPLPPDNLDELNMKGVPTQITLLPPDPVEETPLDAEPVNKIPYLELTKLSCEELIVHAHKIKSDVDLPDSADKRKLVL